MSGTDKSSTTRRNLLQTAAAAGASTALLGGLGINPAQAAVARSEKPLKAAFSNAGLQATWCAQGKQAAEWWGKLFNVEVTWFDGQLDAVKQRAAIDNMASQKWDFVAIQAFGIGTLTQPVQKMIDAGTPVIDMDTLSPRSTRSRFIRSWRPTTSSWAPRSRRRWSMPWAARARSS